MGQAIQNCCHQDNIVPVTAVPEASTEEKPASDPMPTVTIEGATGPWAQLNGTYTKFSPEETGGTSTSELHGQHPYYKNDGKPITLYLYWHVDRWIISPQCDA